MLSCTSAWRGWAAEPLPSMYGIVACASLETDQYIYECDLKAPLDIWECSDVQMIMRMIHVLWYVRDPCNSHLVTAQWSVAGKEGDNKKTTPCEIQVSDQRAEGKCHSDRCIQKEIPPPPNSPSILSIFQLPLCLSWQSMPTRPTPSPDLHLPWGA